MYLNQEVAYRADPSLYGKMKVKTIIGSSLSCEIMVHPETETDHAVTYLETFQEFELAPATDVYAGAAVATNFMPAAAMVPAPTDVPDAPPADWV